MAHIRPMDECQNIPDPTDDQILQAQGQHLRGGDRIFLIDGCGWYAGTKIPKLTHEKNIFFQVAC